MNLAARLWLATREAVCGALKTALVARVLRIGFEVLRVGSAVRCGRLLGAMLRWSGWPWRSTMRSRGAGES
jgi:hypothetical protein